MKLGQGAELQKRLVNIFSFLFFKVGKISVHVQLCSVYYHTHQELHQIEPSPAGGLLQNTGRGLLFTRERRAGRMATCTCR